MFRNPATFSCRTRQSYARRRVTRIVYGKLAVSSTVLIDPNALFFLYIAYNGSVDYPTDNHVYVNPKFKTVIVAGSAGSHEKLSNWTRAPDRLSAKYIYDYG